MEQSLFPGNGAVSVQRRGVDDRGGTVLCSGVSGGTDFAADGEKKLVAAPVFGYEKRAVLGRAGAFLGNDVQLLPSVSFHGV